LSGRGAFLREGLCPLPYVLDNYFQGELLSGRAIVWGVVSVPRSSACW